MKLTLSELKAIVAEAATSPDQSLFLDSYGFEEIEQTINTRFRNIVYELFIESLDPGDPTYEEDFGDKAPKVWARQCKFAADDCAKKVVASIQKLFEQTLEDLHNGDYYDGR